MIGKSRASVICNLDDLLCIFVSKCLAGFPKDMDLDLNFQDDGKGSNFNVSPPFSPSLHPR